MPLTIRRNDAEEWANGLTHGFGLLLSYVGGLLLFSKALATDDPLKITGAFIFCFALIFLYGASTSYHLVSKGVLKTHFRKLDHIGIYLLIAGTYTPLFLTVLKDEGGLSILLFIWIVAGLGILYKIFLINKYPILSTLVYLLMGWTVVIKMDVVMARFSVDALIWLFAGGTFYTIGIIFYMLDKLKFGHAIWHIFVIGGSFCHYLLIYRYAIN